MLAPTGVPHSDAIDAVLAVCDDLTVAGRRHDLKCAEDGGELGSLVGLSLAWESLGYIPAKCALVFRR